MKKIFFLVSVMVSMHTMAQQPSNLYLIGNATPNGWDNQKAEVMTPAIQLNGDIVFTWTGFLKAGDFKFLSTLGSWNSYTATAENLPVVSGQTYDVEPSGSPDYKWLIQEAGTYTVSATVPADMQNLTMTVTAVASDLPTELWITGSAIPGTVQKADVRPDGSTFFYAGALQAGEFKVIDTETIGAATRYVVPETGSPDVLGTVKFQLTSDATLPGWTVSTANAAYQVKADMAAKNVTGKIFTPWDNLYLVGNCTPLGWAADKAIPFEKDEHDPNVFVFDGELKIYDGNEFKLLGQLDWGPNSLHPYAANESIIGSQYVLVNPTGDDKWTIAESQQGRYVIRVDVFQETISAEFKPDGGTGIQNTISTNGQIYIENGNLYAKGYPETASFTVYNTLGQKVVAYATINDQVRLPLIASGVYFVTVTDNGKIIGSKKFIKK